MSKMTLKQLIAGALEPLQTPTTNPRPQQNPFLQANDMKGIFNQDPGVNRPLRHPMFVGYRDNKPIYAGSRLFVLY